MKEYGRLPKELKKQREEGKILEQNLYDDGIHNGKFYPEKKQWSTLVQTASGKHIVSWFLGEGEEWNHVYENNEKDEAYRDFYSVIMEEDFDVQDEKVEDALDSLENINAKDPEVVEAALRPLVLALYQNDDSIKSNIIDIFITLANRNIEMIKFLAGPVLKRYKEENDIKIKRKLLLLLGEIGEKDPSLIKDSLNIFIEDLSKNNIPLNITLLSTLNKISRKNKDVIKKAIPAVINLYFDNNLSIKKLAENLLKNFGLDPSKISN